MQGFQLRIRNVSLFLMLNQKPISLNLLSHLHINYLSEVEFCVPHNCIVILVEFLIFPLYFQQISKLVPFTLKSDDFRGFHAKFYAMMMNMSVQYNVMKVTSTDATSIQLTLRIFAENSFSVKPIYYAKLFLKSQSLLSICIGKKSYAIW